MGRRGYPPGLRRKVLDLVEAGRSVADVARDLEISDQSIYTWRRQDRINRGLVPGLSSGERAELAKAKGSPHGKVDLTCRASRSIACDASTQLRLGRSCCSVAWMTALSHLPGWPELAALIAVMAGRHQGPRPGG
jgi:transposase-like protein